MVMVSQTFKNRLDVESPIEGLGTEVNCLKNVLRCYYDATGSQGGAAGDIGLVDEAGNAVYLPTGAIVTNVFVYVKAAPTVCTSVALKLLSAADLMAATLIASLTTGIFWKGKPVEPAAGAANTTAVGPVTAVLPGTQPKVTIAGSTETTCKLQVFLEYMLTS